MSDNLLRRSNRLIQKKSEKQNDSNCSPSEEDVTIKSKTKKQNSLVCEKCSSNLAKDVIQKSKKRRVKSKLKTCYDSISEKWIKVCNNCEKVLTRMKKISDNSTKVSIEEQKRKYLSNCHLFGLSLVQLLNDSSAERLYCPNMKTRGKACACLQRYIIGSDNNLNDKQRRAQHLLDLLTKAKHLSQQKCYSMSYQKSGQKIGLGNGHKKSKEFENFVNIQRNNLKNEFNFCEKAVQRVLFYSNNFLHKKLKTEPNCRQRVDRQKGKAVTGKLIDIKLLSDQFCCADKCVQLSQTHPQLLEQWRQRAATGQLEARRVLAEMLTPTQSFRLNCFKFVSLVTGSSFQTINKVNEYLIANGGNREPAEHGLKKICIISEKKETNKETSHSNPNQLNPQIIQNLSNNNLIESSRPLSTGSSTIDLFQNDIRIAFVVNETNNEISVINSGKKQTITLLSPRLDLIQNNGQTFQIPVSISPQII